MQFRSAAVLQNENLLAIIGSAKIKAIEWTAKHATAVLWSGGRVYHGAGGIHHSNHLRTSRTKPLNRTTAPRGKIHEKGTERVDSRTQPGGVFPPAERGPYLQPEKPVLNRREIRTLVKQIAQRGRTTKIYSRKPCPQWQFGNNNQAQVPNHQNVVREHPQRGNCSQK